MPKVTPPESRYLGVDEFRSAFFKKGTNELKEGIKEEDTFFTIKEAFTEPKTSAERLQGIVFNKTLGEKILYEFKGKLRDLFDSFTDNTDEWVGKIIKPILPAEINGSFFKGFEVIHSTTEDLKE